MCPIASISHRTARIGLRQRSDPEVRLRSRIPEGVASSTSIRRARKSGLKAQRETRSYSTTANRSPRVRVVFCLSGFALAHTPLCLPCDTACRDGCAPPWRPLRETSLSARKPDCEGGAKPSRRAAIRARARFGVDAASLLTLSLSKGRGAACVATAARKHDTMIPCFFFSGLTLKPSLEGRHRCWHASWGRETMSGGKRTIRPLNSFVVGKASRDIPPGTRAGQRQAKPPQLLDLAQAPGNGLWSHVNFHRQRS